MIGCYYNSNLCEGELWQCETCGCWFCEFHASQATNEGRDLPFHSTAPDYYVECVTCGHARKERSAAEETRG